MKYKYILNAILVVILTYVLMAFSTPVAAAGATVSVDSVTAVQSGGDFTARITLADVTDFDAAQYDVTYNPAVIQVTSVSAGLIGSWTIPVSKWGDITSGTTRVINNVPDAPGVSGSGYLAEIHFHVVGAAGTSSTISLQNGLLGDKDANKIPATWVDGSVQVSSGTTTDGEGTSGGGGGGGPQPGFTYVVDYTSATGQFTADVTAKSPDYKVNITIPRNTIGIQSTGSPLLSIKILEMPAPPVPPADSEVIGLVYDIGPDGATFDPPITITLNYDPAKISEGVSEDKLTIAWWDKKTGDWVMLKDCTVDTVKHTITASVNHFTAFTIMAQTSQPEFVTSDLIISATEVHVGEEVAISVVVTNTGDLSGSHEVALKIDNEVKQTQTVTLEGHGHQTVSFSVNSGPVGEYTVSINNLLKTYVVKELSTAPPPISAPMLTPEPTTTPAPTPEPAATPTPTPITALIPTPTGALPVQPPTNWWFIGGIIAGGIFVVGVLVYFFVWRKRGATRPSQV